MEVDIFYLTTILRASEEEIPLLAMQDDSLRAGTLTPSQFTCCNLGTDYILACSRTCYTRFWLSMSNTLVSGCVATSTKLPQDMYSSHDNCGALQACICGNGENFTC